MSEQHDFYENPDAFFRNGADLIPINSWHGYIETARRIRQIADEAEPGATKYHLNALSEALGCLAPSSTGDPEPECDHQMMHMGVCMGCGKEPDYDA